jgi:hypothetical protein
VENSILRVQDVVAKTDSSYGISLIVIFAGNVERAEMKCSTTETSMDSLMWKPVRKVALF